MRRLYASAVIEIHTALDNRLIQVPTDKTTIPEDKLDVSGVRSTQNERAEA